MFRKLNSKLEKLFDQKNPSGPFNEGPKLIPPSFEMDGPLRSLENLSYVFSGELTQENLPNLFSQLSCYFEIGFLMRLDPNSRKHHLVDLFAFAKKIAPPESSRALRLPQVELYTILKTRARPFLRHFGMSHYDYDDKMFTYMIAISARDTIVVASRDAEPWAKLKIEALQNTLMKIDFSL